MNDRDDVPRIIGHRGAMGHAPENTLSSIRKAAELGCKWVEFDCMLSGDGEVVLFHDNELNRTTDGTGPVSEKSLAEIKTLDAGAWFAPAFAGERVPTLEEAIDLLAELDLGANVEIKPAEGFAIETGRSVAQRVATHWPDRLPAPVLSSFNLEALAEAQAAAPTQDRAILYWKLAEDWTGALDRLDASAIHGSAKQFSDAQIAMIRAAGVPLRIYTVNDPAQGKRLFDMGVGSIITDFPDRFLSM